MGETHSADFVVTSPVPPLADLRQMGEERSAGFALGFGVGGGFGFVFEDIVGADEGEGFGVGFDEVGAGCVDAVHAGLGGFEGVGFEQVGERVEGEMVELAEVEGGDGGVEEVVEEVVSEIVGEGRGLVRRGGRGRGGRGGGIGGRDAA